MGWESEQEIAVEPKNGMKWLWMLVAAIFVVTIGLDLALKQGNTIQTSQAHVQHILIKYDAANEADKEQALSQIENIQTWINEGQDFEKLAKQYSQDEGSKSRGGDLGWIERGKLVDEIEAYIWTAEIEKISDIIPTTFGFHLVRVLEREISEAEQYELDLNRRINERNNPQ
jgi:parvulin-like peptidyl-prolyl isomerase